MSAEPRFQQLTAALVADPEVTEETGFGATPRMTSVPEDSAEDWERLAREALQFVGSR